MFNFAWHNFLTAFQGSPKRDTEWMICAEIVAKYRTTIEISMERKAFNDSTLLSFLGSDLICYHALSSTCLNSPTFTKQASAVTCILQQGERSTERQRDLPKFAKEQQTELVLQVVLLPGSFLMEQGFAAVTETSRRDGCPSGTAYAEARGVCAPVLGLWACPNGLLKPGAVRGQPGSHTGLGALWWEVSESRVPLNAGAASRPGEAFPKLQSPKPSPLVSDQDWWSSCHSCQRSRLQSLRHFRLSSVCFEKERGRLCEPKILKKQFWGKCDFKMTWFSLVKMANCSQLHCVPSYSAGQQMTALLRGRPSKWLCLRIAPL